MVSRAKLYTEISEMLSDAGIDSARFEAQCIFEEIFKIRFPRILMNPNQNVDAESEKKIRDMVQCRINGQPLQYIIGAWEFYGYPFKVGSGVLIPRPDTETIIDEVLRICKSENLAKPRIADLCSGSGCIAVTLKKELVNAEVFAIELSDEALPYLRENAALNNANINIINGDVMKEETAHMLDELDIIVCNPPYLTEHDMTILQKEVSFEPELALYGGSDGLDYYRQITAVWKSSLKDRGYIIYEFGIDQHEAVSRILQENHFINIKLSRDTAGIIRTAAAQKEIGGTL